MKILALLIIAALPFLYFSCSQNELDAPSNESLETVTGTFDAFWSYYNKSTKLSGDFIPVDPASKIINKDQFFNYLIKGEYIPLRLKSKKNTLYKLYKIPPNAPEGISNTIKSEAEREYKRYKMEGKILSQFDWSDLNGNKYNSETTKGQILVLKFWFLHCQKCNEEIPDCNKLVAKYNNRSDINFISLALDKTEDLKQFLAKTKLDYAVVPDQKKYLMQDLGIEEFPTHIIVNQNGVIIKVVTDFKEVGQILERELLKQK